MMAVGVALFLTLLLVGVLLWAGGGKTIHEAQGQGIVESIPQAFEPEPAPPSSLVVLAYDLAYAWGAKNTVTSPPDIGTLYDHLDHIVETIAASGAEVALLQEVDFSSQRTYEVDQLYYIAAALGWGFAARATTWECRYLPWPWRRPTGRLKAGMGVISRHPLVQNRRQRLSQTRPLALLSPLFSPYHTVQLVDVQCGTHTVRLLNVHLAPHDQAARQRQARELVAFAQQVATPTSVLMGAFNAAVSDTQSCDPTMDILTNGLRGRFRLVVDEAPTYPAESPCRRLGHILTGHGIRVFETHVLTPDIPVSAHLPVVAHLRWTVPIVISNGGPRPERL